MQIKNRFPFKIPALRRELLLALLLKGVLLFMLWWAFFSDAPDRNTLANAVADRIAGTAHHYPLTSRSNSHD
jgi:hypothetical protein